MSEACRDCEFDPVCPGPQSSGRFYYACKSGERGASGRPSLFPTWRTFVAALLPALGILGVLYLLLWGLRLIYYAAWR